MKSVYLSLLLLIITSASLSSDVSAQQKTQYVMISFDGSRSLSMWDKVLRVGKQNDARFTFFVSGVYFIADENKDIYKAPRNRVGKSYIGFGGSTDQVRARVNFVKQAIVDGHEISSHANGHFQGGLDEWRGNVVGENWSDNMWYNELDSFLNFLWNVDINNGLQMGQESIAEWKSLVSTQVHGFRAPNLNINDSLENVLTKDFRVNGFVQKYKYDSSLSKRIYKVKRSENGLWDMPLGLIEIHGTTRSTIAMDFNFYAYDSKSKPDNNPENVKRYEERYYKSLLNYFNVNNRGRKTPLFIGNHFSTWNQGAYYRGLMRFIKDVCPRRGVQCISMDQYSQVLEDEERVRSVDNTKVEAPLVEEGDAIKDGVLIDLGSLSDELKEKKCDDTNDSCINYQDNLFSHYGLEPRVSSVKLTCGHAHNEEVSEKYLKLDF